MSTAYDRTKLVSETLALLTPEMPVIVRMETIRLPMHGSADSLNLSVTAAVLAYEAVRQQGGRS